MRRASIHWAICALLMLVASPAFSQTQDLCLTFQDGKKTYSVRLSADLPSEFSVIPPKRLSYQERWQLLFQQISSATRPYKVIKLEQFTARCPLSEQGRNAINTSIMHNNPPPVWDPNDADFESWPIDMQKWWFEPRIVEQNHKLSCDAEWFETCEPDYYRNTSSRGRATEVYRTSPGYKYCSHEVTVLSKNNNGEWSFQGRGKNHVAVAVYARGSHNPIDRVSGWVRLNVVLREIPDKTPAAVMAVLCPNAPK